MREASTPEITSEIAENLISSNFRTTTYLEVYRGGDPAYIEDLDINSGIKWSLGGKKRKYANFSLTPLTGTCSFQVDNINGRYSPGSGTTFENIFDNDVKIRLQSGYYLNDLKEEEEKTVNLNNISGFYVGSYFHRTIYDSGTVKIDLSASYLKHFSDLLNPLYGSETYNDSTYAVGSITVHTYDLLKQDYGQFNGFKITANNTTGTVYYRALNDAFCLTFSNSSDWTSVGNLADGIKDVTITPVKKRFIQVAVIYDGISFSSDLQITDIKVKIQSQIELLYKSVFYLDTPNFDDPPAPVAPKVFCTARDAYKRAINTEINLQDYSSVNISVNDLIKEVCDQIGIKYTSSSISDLTSFPDINLASGLGEVKFADDVFVLIMEKINSENYQMYLEYDETEDDNIMFVKQKPNTSEEADGAFSFTNYVSIGSSKKNNDKALQRFTILSNSRVIAAEEQLDSQVISSIGNFVFSWSGEAEYKRFEADFPDNIRGTVVVTPTTATLTVTEITGTVTVTLYGNKWSSTAPDFEGEAINFNNMMNGIGTTSQSINPILTSDVECKTAAEGFISSFASPIQESQGLIWPYLNLLPEINDVFLMWRRYFLDDNLYFITGISNTWDESENPKQETSFDLDDSGRNFSETNSFVYDDEPTPMKYDSGFLYDMGISTPQSSDAEIDAASIIINNITFS